MSRTSREMVDDAYDAALTLFEGRGQLGAAIQVGAYRAGVRARRDELAQSVGERPGDRGDGRARRRNVVRALQVRRLPPVGIRQELRRRGYFAMQAEFMRLCSRINADGSQASVDGQGDTWEMPDDVNAPAIETQRRQ